MQHHPSPLTPPTPLNPNPTPFPPTTTTNAHDTGDFGPDYGRGPTGHVRACGHAKRTIRQAQAALPAAGRKPERCENLDRRDDPSGHGEVGGRLGEETTFLVFGV